MAGVARTELHSGARRIYTIRRMWGSRQEGILQAFRRTAHAARLLSPGGVRVSARWEGIAGWPGLSVAKTLFWKRPTWPGSAGRA